MSLPEHARVIQNPQVWMEGNAVEQLGRVAELPGCVRAVGLPDLHAGPGVPIGAAFAFDGVIRPLLVGSDAGCGVSVIALERVKATGDALERRAREATDGPALPDLDPGALLAAAWRGGPAGLLSVPGLPDELIEWAEREPPEADPTPSGPVPDDPSLGEALGSVGGGNHFLELGEVTATPDKESAARAGLRRGGFAVLAHSGSRGVGAWLLHRWGDRVLEGPDIPAYLADLAGAQRFARANRLVLCWRLLGAVGAARPDRTAGRFDLIHNTVLASTLDGRPVWLHRKGSAPADAGQPTVVLGSRGAPSWVMEGLGDASCLCSVAHGAGRRMGRSEAVSKLKPRYRRDALHRTPSGNRVLCDDPELLYAEHPDAYKDIDPVIDALEAAGAARRTARLEPRVTVKR